MTTVIALRISRAASLFALAGGMAVLLGWAADLQVLYRPTTGCVVISPWTAVCFTILGLALFGRTMPHPASRRALTLLGTIPVMAVMGFVLFEWYLGSVGKFDLLFFPRNVLLLSMGHPGRPSVQAALSFLALSVAALAGLRQRQTIRHGRWVEALIFVSSSIALLTLFGYACSASTLFGAPTIKGVGLSPYSSVLFLASSLALIVTEPESFLGRILSAPGPSGYVVRRLFPIFIVVPLLLGLLRAESERLGWISRDTGIACMAFGQFLIGMAMLFWVARNLRREGQLKKMVKMSCVSKRILDHGSWVTVEEFLSDHYNVEVSHGMTSEEADQWLHEGVDEIPAADPDHLA